MNSFIVLFVCVALFSTAQSITEEEKAAFHKECLGQTGVVEQTVLNAMNGEFADDPKFKQYLVCFGKKAGFQNDAGEIQKDIMKAKLLVLFSDEAKVEEMITKCAIQKGSPEETAFEAAKCMHAIKPM